MPVGAGVIELDQVLGTDIGDRDLWARSIVQAKKRLNKAAPTAVNLETAITNIVIDDTMKGSSTIVVSIRDEGWELTDSGFFDVDRNGKIDPIDVNYPEGTDLWWRLTQVGLDSTRAGAKIELTFMERPAVYMMGHHGPLKVSRAKRTRAEFLKTLSDKVKAGGGIAFHSKQLHVRQKQAPEDPTSVKAREKAEQAAKEDKDAGINRNEKIKFKNWDGSQVTLKPGELRNAERMLREAFKHTDDERPLLALLEAGIVEAPFFRNPLGGDASSVGILQLLAMHGPASKRRDIAWVTRKFVLDGFAGSGGAIEIAKANKDLSPGEIAQRVQGSNFPDRYEKVRDGADQVLEAFGNAGSGAGEYRKQYNFEVGTTEKPREDYWEASNRLAEEVKWAFFMDGPHIYFDPETALIKQKPVAIIRRGDAAVVNFSTNWDQRQIATEATLILVCDPFEFRAGEVFKLDGFGPASSGSTAKLPGRWLVEEIHRERFSVVSTFTLKQPEDPNPEPRSDSAQRQADEKGETGDLRDKIVQAAKDSMTEKTGFRRYSQDGALTANPTARAPLRSDCSQWVRAIYLKAGAKDPGTNTYEQARKGTMTTKPKPGDLLLTADRGHVELYIGEGRTIGHGTAPIDYAHTRDFPGHFFVTFDFLEPPKHSGDLGYRGGNK